MARKDRKDMRYAEDLGNLLTYPSTGPQRLLFFSTLLDKDYGQNIQGYNTRRETIARQALQYLNGDNFNSQNFLNQSNEKYYQKIETIVKFLQQAIQTQQSNEIKYFKNKLNLLNNMFTKQQQDNMPKELKQLIKLLSASTQDSNNFDYDYFIILINYLLQGRQNTETTVNYELNRLQDVQKLNNQIRDEIANQISKDRFNSLNAIQQKVYRWAASKEIKAHYLEHETITSMNQVKDLTFVQVMGTIDTRMAGFVNHAVNSIWEDNKFLDKITKIIGEIYKKNNMNIKPNEKQPKVRAALVAAVMTYAKNHFNQVLSSLSDNELSKLQSAIEKDMATTYSFNIAGVTDSFGIKSKNLPYFDKVIKENQKQERSAAELYKVIKQFDDRARRIGIGKLLQREKDTYNFLGLSKNGKNNKARQIIDFIDELQNIQQKIKSFITDKNISGKDEKFENVKLILQEATRTKQARTVTLTFTVTKDGKIKYPKDILEQLNINTSGEWYNIANSSAQTLQGLIAALKGKASLTFKTWLDDLSQRQSNQLLSSLRKSLKNIRIAIDGPTQSEIISGIQLNGDQNHLFLQWGGPKNNKNDFVTITMETDIETIRKQFTADVAPKLQKKFNRTFNDIIKYKKEAVKTFETDFVGQIQAMKKSAGKTNKEGYHDYKAKAQAFFDSYTKYKQQMVKILDELSNVDEILKKLNNKKNINAAEKAQLQLKQKIDSLKNNLLDTCYCSETMKTYIQYQNDIGFLGGTIGGNVQEQLNSLNLLFEEAGMPLGKNEYNFLMDLIVNTGQDTILGVKYRYKIENYLGAMAAFALFDEGGAEAEILKEQLQLGISQHDHPDILHLYRLNGIYYPGSYILSETLAAVKDLNKIMPSHQTHGAKITINNQISYKDIPKDNNTTPWQEVYNSAINGKVQLHITFLAGMVQILTNLQQRMQDIVIPQ